MDVNVPSTAQVTSRRIMLLSMRLSAGQHVFEEREEGGRERERDRQTDRQTDRQRERERGEEKKKRPPPKKKNPKKINHKHTDVPV